MFEIIKHRDAKELLAFSEKELAQREAENNLILAIAHSNIRLEGIPDDFYLSGRDNQNFVFSGLSIAPYNTLILTRCEKPHIEELVRFLHEYKIKNKLVLNGVVGPSSQPFAKLWCEKMGLNFKHLSHQGIYQLTCVQAIPQVGQVRTAETADMPMCLQWAHEFAIEATPNDPRSSERTVGQIEARIKNQECYLLEVDKKTVTMCSGGQPTPTGARISFVYTPPVLRGRGYASDLVAQVSQRLFDSGRKFCFLYTDLNNPTSNKIYKRIGYEFVTESEHYGFSPN